MESLKHKPYFIWLFPLVFYLIQLQDYVKYVTFSKIGFDYIIISAIVLFVYFLLRKIFKNYVREITITYFFFLIFYFFFGNIKTALFSNNITKYISSYPILMPLLFVVLYLIFRLLKNNLKSCHQWFQYANTLSLVLIVLQSILLINLLTKKEPKIVEEIKFNKVESSFKNNIYFILMDEYAGNKSLKEYFNYDNAAFNNHLKEKGFFVSDSIHSNYNITVASMNSILNMQYVNKDYLLPYNNYSFFLKSFNGIKNNLLTHFFNDKKYNIQNNSIFEINHCSQKYSFESLQSGRKLLYKNIFHEKIWNDLVWIFCIGKYKINYFYREVALRVFHQNKNIIQETINLSKYNAVKQQFAYSHLLLPHAPFFSDSTGKNFLPLLNSYNNLPDRYLNYLKFANKNIVLMVDSLTYYDKNSIIILMSDHGYRDYPDSLNRFIYNNFLAVRFPDSNYSEIKKVKSNVNVFRVILNQYFNQQLPLLKDSLFFIDEEKNKFDLKGTL